jgi:arylsulfatase A-like enzyme
MSHNSSLLDLRIRDWAAIAVLVGLLVGLAEGIAWLLVAKLNVPRILWAAPLVDCAFAVTILVLGAALAKRIRSPLLLRAFIYITCLLVYEPLRVLFGQSVSKLTVIGVAAALAALLTGFIVHAAVIRPGAFRKASIAGAAVLVVLFCATEVHEKLVEAAPLTSASPSDKNVLVIVVDTLRADHLSLTGYFRPTSPHLDRLAARGIVFEEAISSSSWTLPAHASLLTGLYPHQHHAVTPRDRLPENPPIVSEWFAEHGYRTGAFSANTMFFSRRSGFGRGFDVFRDVYPPLSSLLVTTRAGQQLRDALFMTRITDNLVGRQSAGPLSRVALDWIERDQRPFFAIINFFDVHDPYIPPKGYKTRYGESHKRLGGLGVTFDIFPELSPEELREAVAMYDSSISYVDDQIDALLNELDRRGTLQNTVVVITSDHGEEFNEHGFLTHGNSLYRELVHVPLIVLAPGEAPTGVRIATPVSLTNVPATLIDLATGQTVPEFPRRSLATLWRTPAAQANWPAPISELAQLHICDCFPNSKESFQSVTSGDWHYIAGSSGDEQLFRISTDPTNLKNLVGSAPPEVLTALRLELSSETK